jgi:hypothetical protein
MGSGKSAVVANWLAARKLAGARRSRLAALNPQEEFVFYHVTGCTRQSTFVGHMLQRLMTELKEQFGIDREVYTKRRERAAFLPRNARGHNRAPHFHRAILAA